MSDIEFPVGYRDAAADRDEPAKLRRARAAPAKLLVTDEWAELPDDGHDAETQQFEGAREVSTTPFRTSPSFGPVVGR